MTANPRPQDHAHPLSFVERDWRHYLRDCGLSQSHARSLLSAYASGENATSFSDLPARLSHKLSRDFGQIETPLQIHSCQTATDGVVKWGLRTHDNYAIECVYIPQGKRGTVCLSSQAGCAYGCKFCATARMSLSRHLSSGEIIAQLQLARTHAQTNDLPAVSNAVFMGMGEPLANLAAVIPAIELMTNDNAYALARRRVTVSTVGLADRIIPLTRACDVNLAISLHAPTDALRNRLMPINRRYPLARLIEACHAYHRLHPKRTITIEYLMLSDLNDTIACAQALVALLADLPVKINLIPFNASGQSEFECSPDPTIRAFAESLRASGLVTTIRRSRGFEVVAACGQLANATNATNATTATTATTAPRPSISPTAITTPSAPRSP